jgi:hypothetical protein
VLSKLDWRRKRRTTSRNRGHWFWTGAPRLSVHGPKTDSSNALIPWARTLALGRSVFAAFKKAFEGAAPRLFQPMYAWANMGHPSREEGFSLRSQHCDADQLHEGCHTNWFRKAPVCSCSSSNKINPTEPNNPLVWTALKFGRSCGTKFVNPGSRIRSLAPAPSFPSQFGFGQLR